MARRVPRRVPGLHPRQELLTVAHKLHAVAQRQKMPAHAGDAALATLAGRVALPLVHLRLRDEDRCVRQLRPAIIAHGTPAMIRVRMGQHHRFN
jgi:hypothetical protein